LMFGVQFHPEMDPEILRFLWEPRRATWRDKVTFDLDRALDQLRPAVVSSRVLTNFLTFFAS
jgi:GMP synthase-like glutamine amidotransferase